MIGARRGILSRLPIISRVAAYVLELYAAHAPRALRRGKIFRLIARFCDGHVVMSRLGVRLHVNSSDRTNQLCILGRYDTVPEQIAKLSPGMCFVDIGANAGLFSLMAAEQVGPEGIVIAFEPSPEQFGYLIQNIRVNGKHNILPLPMAVSDVTQRMEFSAGTTGHSGKDHVGAVGETTGLISVYGVNIATDFKAIASFCGDRNTMIKIDVEGFEQRVLHGIRRLLQEVPVVAVIVELDRRSLRRYGATPEALAAELAMLGFSSASSPQNEHHHDEVFLRREAMGTWEQRPRETSGIACGRGPAPREPVWARTGKRLGWFAAGVAATYGLLVAFVAIVDPYGLTDIVSIPRFNAEKTQRLDGGGRVEKSLQLWREDYDIIILGGTSALMGLNPDGASFAGHGAYNAAMKAATMAEISAVGRFELSNGKPTRVIIGLDFSMFEADRTSTRDFSQSGFDGDWMPAVYARSLMTPDAVIDAVQTVYENIRGVAEQIRDDGFQRVSLGREFDYRKAFTEILVKEFLVRDWHYADFDYDPSRIGMLRDLLLRYVGINAKIDVFVSPIHARQLEAMIAKGIYPLYETWLRSLAEVAELLPSVQFWDFSGYNSVTTEEIPDWDDPHQEMRWYWNSARYTPATGELIIAIMSGIGNRAPQDFGRRLKRSTIDAILADNQEDREVYLRNHMDEVADVQRLARRMSQLSKGD
ncbi:FkbM family methyltransferase [Rhodoligotrophos appendicifer]|uniref:FkbM family methyltransferase n=1 Tax=Rhodoligotrophos appendicifer TaxID=987056 RepID=UPI001479112C|nr:FkbM family methyltransferase [Rhodoligotrophos appendicifer]